MTTKIQIPVLLFLLLLNSCGYIRDNKTGNDESLLPFTINQPSFPDVEFNVIDFGATGNGAALETEAIQRAIDHCAARNGGTVYFPPGVYLTGTIFLPSNLRIHLEKGAILLGSDKLEDYPETIQKLRSYTDNYTVRSIIYAEGKENIAITGEGIIAGQGGKFEAVYHPYKIRPYMIRMIECKNILIEDIVLLNSPMWVQHYMACDHLTIRNITVSSRRSNVNNDGIDIDGCHFVHITGCHIDCEDDAIVFKSTMDRSCENIYVNNCVLTTLCNAIKWGTESNGGFRNFIVKDIHIHDTRLSGIALEIVDGGIMDNIHISDITMENVNNPVFIRLGNRARPYTEGVPVTSPGSLKNITIKNIHATNAGYFSEIHPFKKIVPRDAHIPGSISGLPGHPVENVVLENIYVQYSGGHEAPYDTSQPVPAVEEKYPEFNMFGQLPAAGFYLRHVNNIHFNNVVVETVKPDSRPVLFLDENSGNVYRDGKLIE